MNEITRQPGQLPTTQGAQDFQRLRWTLPRFEQLIEAGIFGEHDRVELIGGELVPMSPKGIRHEVVRDEIHQWLVDHRRPGWRHSIEIGWRPDEETYVEPDILLFPDGHKAATVPAREVLLLIEVSHSSLADDKLRKAPVYAGLGIAEYWVVDAVTLATTVHTAPDPSAGAYANCVERNSAEALVPVRLPGLSLVLADLPI